MSYDLEELLNMSIADIKKTGKSKAEYFMAESKYCELKNLTEEYKDYYQICWSPVRSILMFSDGSAMQFKNGQFSII